MSRYTACDDSNMSCAKEGFIHMEIQVSHIFRKKACLWHAITKICRFCLKFIYNHLQNCTLTSIMIEQETLLNEIRRQYMHLILFGVR